MGLSIYILLAGTAVFGGTPFQSRERVIVPGIPSVARLKVVKCWVWSVFCWVEHYKIPCCGGALLVLESLIWLPSSYHLSKFSSGFLLHYSQDL